MNRVVRGAGPGSAALWAATLLTACAPLVEIAGAPCPCPEGFTCCPSLSTCVPEAAVCPDRLPGSTEAECERDADCGPGEVCHAWSVPEVGLAGPRQCRRACADDLPCADAERCDLAPHDGEPLADFHLTRLCAPAVTAPGCEGIRCSDCAPEQVGRSYCEGSLLQVCFVSLHPVCGLSCTAVTLEDCESLSCVIDHGTAKCNATYDDHPCRYLNCSSCSEVGLEPGVSACAGSDLLSCMSLPREEGLCQQACQVQTTTCAPETECRDDGVAACTPR